MSTQISLAELYEKTALDLFGAIPVGKFFGMQLMIDPTMPSNRIRFVDPRTRRSQEFDLPETQAKSTA